MNDTKELKKLADFYLKNAELIEKKYKKCKRELKELLKNVVSDDEISVARKKVSMYESIYLEHRGIGNHILIMLKGNGCLA